MEKIWGRPDEDRCVQTQERWWKIQRVWIQNQSLDHCKGNKNNKLGWKYESAN